MFIGKMCVSKIYNFGFFFFLFSFIPTLTILEDMKTLSVHKDGRYSTMLYFLRNSRMHCNMFKSLDGKLENEEGLERMVDFC